MDFMQDALVSGQRFWLLNVIDDFNREAIVVKAIRRRSANAVICELDRLASSGRQPLSIRSDRGGEFRSIAYEKWAARRGVNRLFSRPRVPTDNAYIENFNKAIRREILSEYDFETLNQVQRTMDSWCLYYNYVRPIEILGNMSPLQFAQTAALKENEN